MATILEDKDRNIIPRWRDYRTTVALGELDPVGSKSEPSENKRDYLKSKLIDWEQNRTLSYASDLMGAALVLGRGTDATEAATYLLSQSSGASKFLKGHAEKYLSHKSATDSDIPELKHGTTQQVVDESRRRIRELRSRLKIEPRNVITLVDLSREYTILGLDLKSVRAMEIALKLNPDNRFILRSAAHLYNHQGDPQYAHRLLRRSGFTRHDPWLLAAEIATATTSGRPPSFVNAGRRLLQDQSISPSHLTELASAIATLEFINGKTQVARKLFRAALDKPTDNSLAQAEWASRHMTQLAVDANKFHVPRIFEARAWELYTNGEWSAAMNQSSKWLRDQPFAIEPVLFSSYLAAAIFEDHERSVRILRFGLMSHRANPTLLNNLAYSLAVTGQVREARDVYELINHQDLNDTWKITVTATGGLLSYKEGACDEGRALYLRAIELARSKSLPALSVRAATYLAREEILCDSPHALAAVELVLNELSGNRGSGLKDMYQAKEALDSAVKKFRGPDNRILMALVEKLSELIGKQLNTPNRKFTFRET
jgi:tetratricopeptide (TPR) repeat protein